MRDFVKEHGLACRGVSFFRQVWDKDVSGIYTDVLSASRSLRFHSPAVSARRN